MMDDDGGKEKESDWDDNTKQGEYGIMFGMMNALIEVSIINGKRRQVDPGFLFLIVVDLTLKQPLALMMH